MNNVKASEANFPTPLPEIRPRIVERIAEFDEHVQRHEQTEDVLSAGIVNQGFDGNQRAARRQGIVGRADKVHLLFQVPVVKDHAHRYELRLGQRILKKIARGCTDAVTEPGDRDVFARNWLHGRQIEGSAVKMRMSLRGFNAEQAGRSADVAEGLEVRKVELRR